MKKHTTKIVIAIICLGFIAPFIIPLFKGAPDTSKNPSITPVEIPFHAEGKLTIKNKSGITQKKLTIEIADTPEEAARGLMFRSSMKEENGMLFIFNSEQQHYFYMRNTRIPLDIVYINSDMEIVHAVKNAVPFDETSLPSKHPVKYVLEINGGMMDKWGIEIGDKISFTKD